MAWWERKNLQYIERKLHLQGFDCEEVAKKFGTPLYLYDGNRFLDNASRLYDALCRYSDRKVRIQFMCKANPSLALLSLWGNFGYKYVVVSSPFEAQLALKAGIKPEYLTFYAGLGTSDDVFKEMKRLKISIVIDSFSQIERMSVLGIEEISVRWNPGLGMGNVPAAGKEADGEPMQFGIPENRILEAFEFAKNRGMRIKGLTQHVGSQIIKTEEIAKYFGSVDKLIDMAKELENSGHNLEYICFGGGLSVPYTKADATFPIDELGKHISEKVKSSEIEIKEVALEPGRYLTADMGILMGKVNLVEEKNGNIFIGVDAGINNMPRRILHPKYQTPHEIIPCFKRDKNVRATTCGTLLFTADNFGTQQIPEVKVGDYLDFINMGAYTASLKFHFGWPFAKEIMAFDGNLYEICTEETFEDYSKNQMLPKLVS